MGKDRQIDGYILFHFSLLTSLQA